MSSTFSVPSWTVTPDATSFFTTTTGGIYLISWAAAAPFFTFQYYDILHDAWQVKTVPQSLILAALGTDVCIERTGKIGSAYVSKTGTVSATARTLTDSGLALAVSRYNNYRIFITGGTGVGQRRRIINHTATTFTIPKDWDVTPDATSTYEVWPDANRIFVAGSAAAALYAYDTENDYWMQGQGFDDGITNNISCKMAGWLPVGVTSGTRIALGVQAVTAAPTAGGTGYVIGDVLTCAVGGTGAQVIVTAIGSGGIVTAIELFHAGTGTGYAVGTGKATSGGTGSGCTIAIATVGPTALIATVTAHWFKNSDVVTFAGCNEGAWNAAHTLIGVNSPTSFSVAVTATLSMAATAAQGTTTLVDPTKNWIANEHVGRLVHIMVAGTAPTSQIRWITANTPTTLTFATIVAAGNGTSKYAIYDAKVFGIDDQRKETGMAGYGQASGGSTTTLIDASKNWIPGQWVGYQFKIEAGTGYGSGKLSITANTATTLTYATQSFTPDATTRYEIADAWGLATAGGTTTPVTESTTKNWVVNQWAGKRLRITGGTSPGQEAAVASNTATALTSAAVFTATDATSTYAILSIPARGSGIAMMWNWGATDAAKKGRYLYMPRGSASNSFDIYDISTGRFAFGVFFSPQSELFTTGSSYAYDGLDSIYLLRSVLSAPLRVFKYNINTNKLTGAATTTLLQNTVHIGNFLEIVNTPDGLPFIYTLQNSGTLLCRALLF